MSEKVYNPKEFALGLGFSEADATQLASVNADATNIRRVAKAKGLVAEPKPEKVKTEPKPHKHYYRKDGTCACGAVRKAKK